jgi:hypothetical protein
MPKNDIVWLTEERTHAELIKRGAYMSLVRYSRGGYDYEILVENDEFVDEGNDDESDED